MTFPPVTLADWRALVDKELAGKSFERTLVHETAEGLAIAPLYTEAPAAQTRSRELRPHAFQICLRHEADSSPATLVADVEEGTDALWLPLAGAPPGLLAHPSLARTFVVLDVEDASSAGGAGSSRHADDASSASDASTVNASNASTDSASNASTDSASNASTVSLLERVAGLGAPSPRFALDLDPLARLARGQATGATLDARLAEMAHVARLTGERFEGATAVMVSTLPYHEAGADAADELACALATGVRYLEALREGGLSIEQAAQQIAVQVAVGRDTFVELCKVRALRTCWQKLLTAAGAPGAGRLTVHAVCSARTMTVRDPWVNMLRVTTQVFAAILGGADLVTPGSFDQAFGAPSPLGRRVARNTGLVLREESFLGQVTDPAGGSYAFETMTDELAREGWRRLQALEREGGIAAALASGRLAQTFEAQWQKRLKQIATRKVAILGVSEFANPGETLPQPVPGAAAPPAAPALASHRDAAAFEELRARAESAGATPEVLLVTLGPFAESRPRAGFAAGFFAAGGLRARESATDEGAAIACLCGSDERYAAEAVERARALKAIGCRRVLVAGRPGALEGALREAGVEGFLFVGCDAVDLLSSLLSEVSS